MSRVPGWFFIEVRDPEGKDHSDPYSLKITRSVRAQSQLLQSYRGYFRAVNHCLHMSDERRRLLKFYVASQAIAKFKLDSVPEDMKGEL